MLIPTYRYRKKVVRAVRSALASGAGEVIVTDDLSRDGTVERLRQFADPRLKVHENERNLGLWENHLRALGLATRPWIKFVQADDYLLPGGLAAFAAGAAAGVTVVWGAPTLHDDATRRTWRPYALSATRRLGAAAVQGVCLKTGWLLGSPSHMMLRADAIHRDAAAWRTALSADLVIGSIAAARGDTVLLPPGAVGQGCHPLQDAKVQGSLSGLARLVASLDCLRMRPEPGLRRFATLWAIMNLWPALRTAASGTLRREATPQALAGRFLQLPAGFSPSDLATAWRARREIAAALRYRQLRREPHDLDELLGGNATLAGALAAA